jgi:hypothetical protein
MSDALTKPETFHLEEFRALRGEIEFYLTESRSQERYTLIALGAIWGWLILNHFQDRFLWFIPVVLTIATTVRMVAMLGHFNNLGDYIKTIEHKFGTQGWECKRKRWTLGASYVVLDISLLIISMVGYHCRGYLAAIKL